MNAVPKTCGELAFDLGIHAEPLLQTRMCPHHGEYEAKCRLRDFWTGCPQCSREESAAKAELEERRAKAAAIERWHRQLGCAGIPERFQDRTLASYDAKTEQQQRALAFAQSYADRFDEVMETGRGALFIGLPGTGKTHLAVGIALEVMTTWNGSALFTTTLRAVRRVKDTWSRAAEESETEAIKALTFPDLLVLDEVGVQFGSDTERLILFDILNERYAARKPSILLSNLTVDEVRGYLGERIFDRMREDGGQVVVFDWPSYRGMAGNPDGAK